MTLSLLIVTAGMSVPAAADSRIEALAGAVEADADQSEHEAGDTRRATAERARSNAEECLARAPEAAACQYAQGLALGLAAREHPLHARTLLHDMLASLARAEATDPDYDAAGPARVQALVLLRAPGWPLGPGNVAEGLAAAQRAVMRHPEYPPNWLALAEAQAKSGSGGSAHESGRRAHDAALAFPASPRRDAWLAEADSVLAHR